MAISSITTIKESTKKETIQGILMANRTSLVGIFSMEDVLMDEDEDAENSQMVTLGSEEDVLKSYHNFKKFDYAVDHSDHFFSTQSSAINPVSLLVYVALFAQ